MIEIFTKAPGGSGKADRSLSDSLNLRTPSDVHFGSTSPGIAFYEKAGADLRVTLLNGKVVMLQNFFALGPNGEFSRLLTAEGGPAEVTGLIAPEPFVPRDDAPVLTSSPAVEAEALPAAPAVQAQPVVAQPAAVESVATDGEAPAAAGGEGGFDLFGVPGDLMAFGLANVGLLWAGLSSDNDTQISPVPSSPETELDPTVVALLAQAPASFDALDLLLAESAAADQGTMDSALNIFADFEPSAEADLAFFAADLAPFDDLPAAVALI